MARVFTRKALLLLLVLPLLNALGFYYANSLAASHITDQFDFMAVDSATAPFWSTYRAYVLDVVRGNLGMLDQTPITGFITEPLGNSLGLLALGFALTLVLGPLLGISAIKQPSGRIRPLMQTILTVGSSVPGFFLGSVLIVFVLYLSRWGFYRGGGTIVPIQGFGFDAHLILPLVTLAARPILYVAYLTAGLLETELQQDYVRVARSKGLRWSTLLWRHALPNISASVIVALGQSLRLLAGALILVEALFDWRGIGRLFLNVVALNEEGLTNVYFLHPPLLALLVVIFGALLLLADLIATTLASLVDPRLRQLDAQSTAG